MTDDPKKKEHKDSVPPTLVENLNQAFKGLVKANQVVKESIFADRDAGLPAYTTSADDGHPSDKGSHEEAYESIARMFMHNPEDYQTLSGFLCASEATIDAITALNNSKDNLKQAVADIKDKHQDKNKGRVARQLIEKENHARARRVSMLDEAMRITHTKSLDLRRCYAQIRIAPYFVERLAWTWATNHSRMKRYTTLDLLAHLDELSPDKAKDVEYAKKVLAQCSPTDKFVIKATQKVHQLRANVTYRDEDGSRIDEPMPISGIMVGRQDQLPNLVWRSDPDEQQPSGRTSTISAEPFIEQLNIYSYVR